MTHRYFTALIKTLQVKKPLKIDRLRKKLFLRAFFLPKPCGAVSLCLSIFKFLFFFGKRSFRKMRKQAQKNNKKIISLKKIFR